MKLLIVGIIVVIGLGALVFSSGEVTTKPKTFATVQSAVAEGGQLLDVRTASEYAGGHISGATNLAVQDIQTGKMPDVAKDKPVFVYCQSGNRSAKAVAALKSAGYTNVIDLGGIAEVQKLGGIIKS